MHLRCTDTRGDPCLRAYFEAVLRLLWALDCLLRHTCMVHVHLSNIRPACREVDRKHRYHCKTATVLYLSHTHTHHSADLTVQLTGVSLCCVNCEFALRTESDASVPQTADWDHFDSCNLYTRDISFSLIDYTSFFGRAQLAVICGDSCKCVENLVHEVI